MPAPPPFSDIRSRAAACGLVDQRGFWLYPHPRFWMFVGNVRAVWPAGDVPGQWYSEVPGYGWALHSTEDAALLRVVEYLEAERREGGGPGSGLSPAGGERTPPAGTPDLHVHHTPAAVERWRIGRFRFGFEAEVPDAFWHDVPPGWEPFAVVGEMVYIRRRITI